LALLSTLLAAAPLPAAEGGAVGAARAAAGRPVFVIDALGFATTLPPPPAEPAPRDEAPAAPEADPQAAPQGAPSAAPRSGPLAETGAAEAAATEASQPPAAPLAVPQGAQADFATAGLSPLWTPPSSAADAADPPVSVAAKEGGNRRSSPGELAAAVAAVLADPMDAGRLGLKPQALEALTKVYADRGYAPMWTGEQGLRLGAATLVEAFLRAGDDGLEPDEYLPRRSVGGAPSSAADLATAEVELSAALVRYATDLKVGRLKPTRTDSQGTVLRKEIDPAAVLRDAAVAGDLGAYLRALAPSNSLYAGMRRSLIEYRRAAARGGWPEPAPDRLEPGHAGEPVARLRAILRATGDLINFAGGDDGAPYDEALAVAVKSFQERHGLSPDGVVGTETREAMAVGVDERLRQILLNMERVRWLPDDLGDPHLMVNLAGFTLSYVKAGEAEMTMRAIVGKPARSSPEFSGLITYLEVNPSWSVPRIIAVEDLLPKIRKDPGFLANNGFSLRSGSGGSIDAESVNWSAIRPDSFPYALRQKPGPSNALGQVKFMFPNSFDVYLHDTPARGLFSQPVRAYSSGCIRLEKPVELAAKLLEANGNWGYDRLRATISGGQTRSVILSRPVPVHLTYLTSWRDPDGTVQFRPDIYGRDREMDEALVARGTQLVAANGAGAAAAVALP
jgi:murein L,D-transpeptidase YcbB/YkuD